MKPRYYVLKKILSQEDIDRNMPPELKAFDEWSMANFRKDLDCDEYENRFADSEEKLIQRLNESKTDDYYSAINRLACIRSKNAVPYIAVIAFSRKEKDNRDRWMATRALGLIGDKAVIGDLIHLMYHYNNNTRLYARVSLIRLAGEDLGPNWQKWAVWYKQNIDSSFSSRKIVWTKNIKWANENLQRKNDKSWLKNLKDNWEIKNKYQPKKESSGPSKIQPSDNYSISDKVVSADNNSFAWQDANRTAEQVNSETDKYSQKPAGQVKEEKTALKSESILEDVNAMMAEMQPCLTEIQKEAVHLQQLKDQNAPQVEIKASENHIEELGKKIDAIGNKWGKKMDSSGEQVGKDAQVRAQEYGEKYWEQFGERMAQWGEQFGEKMQRKYEQTSKTWDTGKNSFEKTENLSAPFAEGSLLVAETLDSDITVTGGLGTDCRVTAKIRARASTSSDAEELVKQVKIDLKQEPGKVTVAIDNNESKNVSVDLNITVPRKASLQCRTGDRHITCSELEGQITANVGDGSIAITKLLGNASLKLGDGQIKYADSKGSFDAQLGDGKIIARNTEFTEKCDINMGDGQLIFENIRGKAHYEISVKDGTAKFAYAKDADGVGHMELDVADGKIEFGCPANMSAKIEADVEDGTIQTSLPLAVDRKEDSAELDGTLGTGEGHIELSVKDGTIKINAEDDNRVTGENSQKTVRQNKVDNEMDKVSESSAAEKKVNAAKVLKITVYEGNDAEPQTSVYIPLVAMKIVHQLLPPKDKLQMIAQKIKLDESLPEGMDSNSLIDMLDGMLKQVDKGIEATTLLEVKDGTDHVIIALE
jgi:hypothetical protein